MPTQHEPTDREILLAIFNLLGALAERATGEKPSVRFRLGEGNFVQTVPDLDHVSWIKSIADAEGRGADLQELRSTRVA